MHSSLGPAGGNPSGKHIHGGASIYNHLRGIEAIFSAWKWRSMDDFLQLDIHLCWRMLPNNDSISVARWDVWKEALHCYIVVTEGWKMGGSGDLRWETIRFKRSDCNYWTYFRRRVRVEHNAPILTGTMFSSNDPAKRIEYYCYYDHFILGLIKERDSAKLWTFINLLR